MTAKRKPGDAPAKTPRAKPGKQIAKRDDVSEAHKALERESDEGKRLRKVSVEDGALNLEGCEEAQRLVASAFGSGHREFQTYCLSQLINILPDNPKSADVTLPVNAALAMLNAIKPQDELEAMLAVQMVASNHLALASTRRAAQATTIDSRQLNGNLATKFSRTFVAQLEALGRHRRGGKQIVEHVHVNAGGQALIAGTVNTGGRG
jgi:hypothetical protein